MFSRVLFILVASAISAHASATPEQYAECAATKAAMDRLACYDTLAASESVGTVISPAPDNSATGNWAVEESKDPIDDTTSVIISTNAQAGSNQFGRPVALFIRCKSLELEVFIGWNDYLASDGGYDSNQKSVTTRFGSEVPQDANWSTSTDQTATFAPSPNVLLKKMVENAKFTAQVTPYHQGPTTAVFDTRGLDGVLPPLVKACGLKF